MCHILFQSLDWWLGQSPPKAIVCNFYRAGLSVHYNTLESSYSLSRWASPLPPQSSQGQLHGPGKPSCLIKLCFHRPTRESEIGIKQFFFPSWYFTLLGITSTKSVGYTCSMCRSWRDQPMWWPRASSYWKCCTLCLPPWNWQSMISTSHPTNLDLSGFGRHNRLRRTRLEPFVPLSSAALRIERNFDDKTT